MKVSASVINQPVRDNLKNLELKVRKGMAVELDDIGQTGWSMAVMRVPIDTGFLMGSIGLLRRSGVNSRSLTLRATAPYASFPEFGIGQRAQPFITPAVEWMRQEIAKRLPEVVKRESKLDG